MNTAHVRTVLYFAVASTIAVLGISPAWSQELGGAGTVEGTVKDPTGGQMVSVTVELSNPLTGLKRSAGVLAHGAHRPPCVVAARVLDSVSGVSVCARGCVSQADARVRRVDFEGGSRIRGHGDVPSRGTTADVFVPTTDRPRYWIL